MRHNKGASKFNVCRTVKITSSKKQKLVKGSWVKNAKNVVREEYSNVVALGVN